MKLQVMKTGALVVGMAVLTYIFFPVNAKPGKGQALPGQTISAASHRTKSKTNTVRNDTQASQNKADRKTVKEARIEPDLTLRRESRSRRHSGPPSKMYGGL